MPGLEGNFQIPIYISRFNQYNTDGIPGLGALELENMAPDDAFMAIRDAIEKDPKMQTKIIWLLKKCNPNKRNAILDYTTMDIYNDVNKNLRDDLRKEFGLKIISGEDLAF